MTASDPSSGLAVLALVQDLIFAAKISTSAKALNAPVKIVRDPAKLLAEPGRLLLVDLNLDGAIDAASAWRERHHAQAVGFVAHTDAETIFRARASGIDRVLARSQFVNLLQELLVSNHVPAVGET